MENRKIKILAIDDNRDNLISLKALLSEVLPQSVVYMELSGQGGIGTARKIEPDVILLDIVMPGMDGYEVCKTLKADKQLSETPVIFLTALKGDKHSRILALEAGGEAFLAKPIDEIELKAQIHAMLKIKEAAAFKRDEKLQLEALVQKRTEELKNANIAALNLLEDLNTEIEIRKQREEALKESEVKYRYMFENNPQPMWIYDLETLSFLEVNDAAINHYGYSREEFLSMTLKDMRPKEDIEALLHDVEKTRMSYNPAGQWRHLKKNGELIFVEIISHSITFSNRKARHVLVNDITERKQAEEKEKELLKRHELISLHLPGVIYQFRLRPDGSSHFPYASPGIYNIYGVQPKDVEHDATSVFKAIHPDDLEQVSASINHSAQTLTPWHDIYRTNQPSGKTIWVEGNSTPQKLEDGSVIWHGFIQDITERKQAEELLAKSEDRFNRAISGTGAGLWDWDMVTNTVYFSPQWKKMLGYEDHEIPNDFSGWRKLWHPDEVASNEKEVNDYLEGTSKVYEVEHRLLCKDGSWHWILTRGDIEKDSNGKPIRWTGTNIDITERKQAEEKLKLLNRAVEASSVSVVITDAEGNINYVNPFFTEFTGYSHEEVLGKNPRFLKSGNHPKTFYENLWNTILSGKDWTGEFRNKKRNGELYWEKAVISPILNSKGEVINFVAIKEDITEHKRFEDTRKLLLEISQLATKHITPTSFLAEVHQKLKKIIRSDNFYVALYNEKDQTFSFPYHVDEYDSIEMNKPYELRNSYTDHVLKTNQSLIVTPENQHAVEKDGSTKEYGDQLSVWLGVPFKTTEGSKPNGVIAIQDYQNLESYTETDKSIMEIIAHSIGSFIERIKYIEELVQARKKAEESEEQIKIQRNEILFNNERLESLLEVSQLQTNSVQELLDFALKQAVDLTKSKIGYIYFYAEEKKQFILNTWSKDVMKECSVMNPQTVYDLDKTGCWGEAVRQRKPIIINDYHEENSIKKGTPEGHVILEKFLTIPVIFDNKIVAVAGVANKSTDYNSSDIRQLTLLMDNVWKISERLTLIRDLLAAKEKAEESDKLKTAFINNISHEIRTPLNGILGFGQFLIEPDLSEEERRGFFEHVEKSGNRLMNTVTDYMDMAMLVSNTLEVTKKDFALEAVFGKITEKTKKLCEEKNIEFKLEIPKEAQGLTVNSDPEFIQKILDKLLDNAIKFTKAGSIICGCQIKTEHLSFFVKDTGSGIDEGKLDLMFEAFRQADTAITRGYEGSGLGLTIAKGLVTLLGGEITVNSEKGKGSEFTVTIPNTNSCKTTISELKNMPKPQNTKKPLILIAEDDESNYDYLAIVLDGLGYNYLHAVNGQEAVNKCRQNPEISLVLMDIKMPVMQGDEATRQIRAFRPELPIIATTAHAQTGDEQRFLDAGCNDYISKPIRKTTLLGKIQKFL